MVNPFDIAEGKATEENPFDVAEKGLNPFDEAEKSMAPAGEPFPQRVSREMIDIVKALPMYGQSVGLVTGFGKTDAGEDTLGASLYRGMRRGTAGVAGSLSTAAEMAGKRLQTPQGIAKSILQEEKAGNGCLKKQAKCLKRRDRQGKKYLVLTNNSLYTPKDLAHRLQAIDLEIDASHIFTSAVATANFLESQLPNGTAYVIGESGLTEAIHSIGYVITDLNPDYVVLRRRRSTTTVMSSAGSPVGVAPSRMAWGTSEICRPRAVVTAFRRRYVPPYAPQAPSLMSRRMSYGLSREGEGLALGVAASEPP